MTPYPRRRSNDFGKYIAPGHRFSVSVPPHWVLKEDTQEYILQSPSGKTAVVLTVFRKRDTRQDIDARSHLRRFMSTVQPKTKPELLVNRRGHCSALYTDLDGKKWYVSFLAKQRTLVLATCNSDHDAEREDTETGFALIDSLELL